MAKISAAMVKQLREMTDAPMMECKKALVEADGDLEKAVDVLRTMGIAKAVKRAGRATNEGTIAAYVASNGKAAPAWLEVDIEKLQGSVLQIPVRNQIDLEIDAQLIVELYSK